MSDRFEPNAYSACDLDRDDPLVKFQRAFYLPRGHIYLDGNSLGLLCRPAEETLAATIEQWKTQAIGGWLDAHQPWFGLAESVGAQLAPLLGADPDEVVLANSTTVNLHQLLSTFYRPHVEADVILTDSLCFPSDRYAMQSFLRLVGRDPAEKLRCVPSEDGWTLDEDAIIAAMDANVQLAIFPSVIYTSGQLLDIARLTRAAHDRSIVIGFDCSHSVGVVPHELTRHDVDFAFFCTYKYLNGGPGSQAAIYLNKRHFGRPAGLAGWFGSDKLQQFAMSNDFQQAAQAGGLQIGTPSILAAASLRGALQLIQEAGVPRIREKSLKLTAFLRRVIDDRLSALGVACVEPTDDVRRGGHVAVRHDEARGISAMLRKLGVISDFRPPNIIRLAPAPLYNSFQDCYHAVLVMERVIRHNLHHRLRNVRDQIP